jgi:hypothetical protein
MTDESTTLSWDVHVAPPERLDASDLAPGEEAPSWSPIAATLICGERDAVLVDALLTLGQAHDLADWIAAHGKNLTAVYDPQRRREWIAALDTIDSLHPQTVIAGHQRAGRHDGPEIIEETRQYIRDFDRIAETTSTARELYNEVIALYPDRINPDALRISAQAVKPSRSDEQ